MSDDMNQELERILNEAEAADERWAEMQQELTQLEIPSHTLDDDRLKDHRSGLSYIGFRRLLLAQYLVDVGAHALPGEGLGFGSSDRKVRIAEF
ncbi:unnamed protein product [Haemonchus placei]|uniref:PH domain-containing protein n=1 Tax=Haemonchus placei TaxID=6290 RepID=A0A0N4WDM3_HAEPC|nr:unnamed protein product [Haemonchus placei]